MKALMVARTNLGPVEMFNLAVEHGATAILDLRRQPGPIPPAVDHIYQHPAHGVFPRFAERFLTHWPCALTCDAQHAAVCDCPYVLLLLADDGEATAAVELIRRARPQARSLDGSW